MKTKIVYVLVSSNNDIYLEQAYVSMYSVKYYMPDAHITLLTDKLTEATFIGIRKKEIQSNSLLNVHETTLGLSCNEQSDLCTEEPPLTLSENQVHKFRQQILQPHLTQEKTSL